MIDMNNSRKKISIDFPAMGTDISVDIITELSAPREMSNVLEARKALRQVQEIFQENEKIFSRFREDSELSMINCNLRKETFVSEKMFAVLELCMKFHGLSDGYFDPRVLRSLEIIGYSKDFRTNDLNSADNRRLQFKKNEQSLQEDLLLDRERKMIVVQKKIDTTGIAKGYCVDEAAQYLKDMGFENFIVDAGGDMFALGSDENGEEWKIGVEGMDNSRAMLKLSNEGIATSGISRKRWTIGDKKVHHLINPKDPKDFSFDIKTVTVIDEKTVEADGRAKVLVIMGKERGLQFANENNIKALFLDYKGNVYISKRMRENIIK